MLTTETMTKDQRSCLLYVEACCVDNSGLLEPIRMNSADFDALEMFKEEGLLDFGRCPSKSKAFAAGKMYWVTLHDKGWSLAHLLRGMRAGNIGPMRKEVDAMIAERGEE